MDTNIKKRMYTLQTFRSLPLSLSHSTNNKLPPFSEEYKDDNNEKDDEDECVVKMYYGDIKEKENTDKKDTKNFFWSIFSLFYNRK